MVWVACRLEAQPALEFFTNQANALLQAQFGFGVTNIPVYSPTNSAVGYSDSIHFLLQSAADQFDATTPATDLPSVFRPLFSLQNSNLFITGYACATTNYEEQISRGFKTPSDPNGA